MTYIPKRMCCACRIMKPKEELIRFSKDSLGNIVIDNKSRLDGRGAYLCRSGECIDKAEKKKSLNRHFSCMVDKSVYLKAREFING